MKVVYLASTKNDLVWFYDYYTTVFSQGAEAALIQFDRTAEMLSTNPYIGKKIQGEARQLVIAKTPFSYIYRITDEYIEVMRIWDDRQDSLI